MYTHVYFVVALSAAVGFLRTELSAKVSPQLAGLDGGGGVSNVRRAVIVVCASVCVHVCVPRVRAAMDLRFVASAEIPKQAHVDRNYARGQTLPLRPDATGERAMTAKLAHSGLFAACACQVPECRVCT